MDGVYLLHGEPSRHYVGWSSDITQRLVVHAAGQGALHVRQWVLSGVPFWLAAAWPSRDKRFERNLKRGRDAHPCPWCRPERFRRQSSGAIAYPDQRHICASSSGPASECEGW
jgi:predicted GIY-YIG superfamily endonuclease